MSELSTAAVGAALSTALPAGRCVGEFQIQTVLAVGTTSIIYRALDRARACEVALKEYLPHGLALRNSRGLVVSAACDADVVDAGRRQFLREGMELSRIQHPGLMVVHRTWQQGGTVYRAMPLVEGPTLAAVCRQAGLPPGEDQLRAWLRALLDLLGVLHQRHCHGVDLSAGNILLQGGCRPLLKGVGPRVCVAPGAAANTRLVDPPWADLQRLAQTALGVMAPGLEAGLYSQAFVKSMADTASGTPASRLPDAAAMMRALDLPERRARIRLNRDPLLARHAAQHAAQRRQVQTSNSAG